MTEPQHQIFEKESMEEERLWEKTILPIEYFQEIENGKYKSPIEIALNQTKATWKVAFEAGVRSVDTEVEKLVDKVNELGQMVKDNYFADIRRRE